jgi:hypothetical protein
VLFQCSGYLRCLFPAPGAVALSSVAVAASSPTPLVSPRAPLSPLLH